MRSLNMTVDEVTAARKALADTGLIHLYENRMGGHYVLADLYNRLADVHGTCKQRKTK